MTTSPVLTLMAPRYLLEINYLYYPLRHRIRSPRSSLIGLHDKGEDLPATENTLSLASILTMLMPPQITLLHFPIGTIFELCAPALASPSIRSKKFINYLDQSPAYWAAMILYPGHKKRWIEKHLPKQQADSAIENFQSFFTQNYDQDGTMSGDRQVPSLLVCLKYWLKKQVV
jgi:hypothetical protein